MIAAAAHAAVSGIAVTAKNLGVASFLAKGHQSFASSPRSTGTSSTVSISSFTTHWCCLQMVSFCSKWRQALMKIGVFRTVPYLWLRGTSSEPSNN